MTQYDFPTKCSYYEKHETCQHPIRSVTHWNASLTAVSILPHVIDPTEEKFLFWGVLIGLSGTFIGVCYAKGAPPKWRWGNFRDEKKKNPE